MQSSTSTSFASRSRLAISVPFFSPVRRSRLSAYQTGSPSLQEVVAGRLDVYAISDLHTDYTENLRWVQHLAKPSSAAGTVCNAIIVAGDISDDIRVIRETFTSLTAKFDHVFFVPGNHELWVKADPERNAGAQDSVAKLHAVLALCDELGVITKPCQLGQLLVVPIFAWHHKSFDKEADIPGIPPANAMTVADYGACTWPADQIPGSKKPGADAVAEWFDHFNEQYVTVWKGITAQHSSSSSNSASSTNRSGSSSSKSRSTNSSNIFSSSSSSSSGANDSSEPALQLPQDVLSFSHFLPHQHLLPEKRYLSFPNLAKAVGSDFLWERVKHLAPQLHVFGHSHFAWDAEIEGMRFIQAPLCYPAERKMRAKSIHVNPEPWSTLSSTGHQSYHHHHHQHHHQHELPATEGLPVLVYRANYKAQLLKRHENQLGNKLQAHTGKEDPEQQQQQHVQRHSARLLGLTNEGGLPVFGKSMFQEVAPGSTNSSSTNLWNSSSPSSGVSSSSSSSKGAAASMISSTWHTTPQAEDGQLKQEEASRQRARNDDSKACNATSTTTTSNCYSSINSRNKSLGFTQVYQVCEWGGEWCGNLGGLWSDVYKGTPRDPENVKLAPWVLKRYRKYRKFAQLQELA